MAVTYGACMHACMAAGCARACMAWPMHLWAFVPLNARYGLRRRMILAGACNAAINPPLDPSKSTTAPRAPPPHHSTRRSPHNQEEHVSYCTVLLVRTYVPPLSRAVVLYHSSNQTPPTTCSSERSFNFQILLPTTFVSNYPNMLHLNTWDILTDLLILFVFFLQKNT